MYLKKEISHKKAFGIVVFLLFLILLGFIVQISLYANFSSFKQQDNKNSKNLKTSYLSSPIFVDGNQDWEDLKNNEDFCSGEGTSENPYIIKDLLINGESAKNCIFINNTDTYFEIKNCTVYNSDNGITLQNVSYGKILNNTFFNISWCMINITTFEYLCYINKNITIFQNHFINFTSPTDDISSQKVINLICCEFVNITNNTIKGKSSQYYGSKGIYFQLVSDCIISKNDFIECNYGINTESTGSQNFLISENEFSDCIHGLVFNGGEKIQIINNTINCSSDTISFSGIYEKNYKIINNTLFNNGLDFWEYDIESLVSHEIVNNTVNGKNIFYHVNGTALHSDSRNFQDSGQIYLINCSDTIISKALGYDINISNMSRGISILYGGNNTIKKTNLKYNHFGLFLYSTTNNTIESNELSFNSASGIWIYANQTIIKENNITNNEYWGIERRWSEQPFFGINISNNTILDNDFGGIRLSYGFENIVSYNDISYNGFVAGIQFSNLNKSIISFNNISYNQNYGIRLSQSENNDVKNNTLNFNSQNIVNSDNNRILGNNISYGDSGIYLYSSKNITLKNNFFHHSGLSLSNEDPIEFLNNHSIDKSNKVNGKRLYYYVDRNELDSANFTDSGQIILINCNDSILENLNISNALNGISLFYSENISISQSNLTKCTSNGVILSKSDNITISDSNFMDNDVGITFYSTNNSNINNNYLKNNRDEEHYAYGIHLYNSINNTLYFNNFSHNSYGVSVHQESNHNQVFNNSFFENDKVGMSISNSKDLFIDNNSFLGSGIFINPGTKKYLSNLSISTNNKVNGKSIYYYVNQENLSKRNFTFAGEPGQIFLIGCNHSYTSDHLISNTNVGVQTFYCSNLTFSNISFEGSVFGSGFFHSLTKNLTLTQCISNNNTFGIILDSCNDTRIFDSKFAYNQVDPSYTDWSSSIYISGSPGTIVQNCNISNSLKGIYFYGPDTNSDCEVRHNTIYNNKDGIIIKTNSPNSIISHNNITNNQRGINIGYSSHISVYHNNFIENGIHAIDNFSLNNWDDGNVGNYWDDYSGSDILPKDGIGDLPYSLSGTANSFDNYPLLYPTFEDTDGDGLKNLEEYTEGVDNYRTNITNSDSDYDALSDYWEWIHLTDPWNNDTDGDKMPDGWEVSNSLDPNLNESSEDLDNDTLTNLEEYYLGTAANNNDTDGDLMSDGWEVSNSLNPGVNDSLGDFDADGLGNLEEYYIGTAANNFDTDSDNFSDGIEVSLGTNPLDNTKFPKADLSISEYNCSSVNISLTILNMGIWNASDIVVYMSIPSLNLTLYNNSAKPFNLSVNETHTLYVSFLDFEDILEKDVSYNVSIIIDPDNIINELDEENNFQDEISFNYLAEDIKTPDYFMFTMILTLIGISIPLLGALVYIMRKKKISEVTQEEKKEEQILEQSDVESESGLEELESEIIEQDTSVQNQEPSNDQKEDALERSYPVREQHKRRKSISRINPNEVGDSRDLTEDRLEEMARTESEMEFENFKLICLVHKGEITRNIYVCPSCQSFYCDRCARVLKLKGEKCWYCKEEMEIQLRDTDQLLLLEKRATELVEEMIKEDPQIQESVITKMESEGSPELESEAFYLLNPENLDKIDLLDLSIEEKKIFLQELFKVPFEERGDLIEEKLEVKEDD